LSLVLSNFAFIPYPAKDKQLARFSPFFLYLSIHNAEDADSAAFRFLPSRGQAVPTASVRASPSPQNCHKVALCDFFFDGQFQVWKCGTPTVVNGLTLV
jgi:hypothetical protein